MKKFLIILMIYCIFTSCNSNFILKKDKVIIDLIKTLKLVSKDGNKRTIIVKKVNCPINNKKIAYKIYMASCVKKMISGFKEGICQ